MFDLLSHWTVILGVFLFVTWIFRDTILYWLFKEPKVLGGIVVTGCASGIGEDVVNHFAKLGYRVYAGVRQEKDLNHWRGQSNVVPMLLDITNEEHIRNAVDLVSHDLQEHNMELICLVNNAGMPLFLPFECLDTESIRKIVEVNLIGHIAVSNAFIPLLRKTRYRSTRIFHVSSVVGQMNLVTGGAYTMSKHALEAFADVQRPELAYSSNIKVVILQPGQIETPFATKNVNILKNNLLQISAEKMHYYQPLIERLESMLLGRGGVPPSEVSQVIERALISKFPRTRYRIGKEAILVPIVMFVPDRVMDYVQLFGMQLLYKRSPIFQPQHSKDE